MRHVPAGSHGGNVPLIPRTESTAEFLPTDDSQEIEYFLASDASAVIEHTNRVIYLEVRGEGREERVEGVFVETCGERWERGSGTKWK